MKTLYLDCFSGISGDMFIGALLDLGADPQRLEQELAKLGLGGYHLHVARGKKSGIDGVKFDVHLEGPLHHAHEHTHTDGTVHAHPHDHSDHAHEHEHEHEHHHHHAEDGHSHPHEHEQLDDHGHGDARDFGAIKALIEHSGLSGWVKERSLGVFQRIAIAEGKIHGVPPDRVHFHEVGAVDSIVDIVGGCIALELLGKPRVLASAVVEGTGWVRCAHGRFPVPTPATLAILGDRGVAVTQCDEPHELVTPTGAALLAELVETFGPMQNLVASRIGYGLGTRDNQTRPNVLRAVLGEVGTAAAAGPHDWETDTVAVLETNLDDISPEVLGDFGERALAAGALDVFHTPIQMKKNRPAVLLTILCAAGDADRFTEMLLVHTSAFGVRRAIMERRKLRREFRVVKTEFGEVTVKLGLLDGRVVQSAPEYESCRTVATRAGVPLKTVYEAAGRARPVANDSAAPGSC